MIGKTLKYMRRENKFSQEDIGKVISVARNTVSQYETEIIQPTFLVIEKIADVCGFDVYFEDRDTNEKFKVNDIARNDI